MGLRRKRAVWPSSSNFVVITDQKTPKLRRNKRFRRYRRVVISDFFCMYWHSGPNFWSWFRRYIRFVVITDVVINDFYCIIYAWFHNSIFLFLFDFFFTFFLLVYFIVDQQSLIFSNSYNSLIVKMSKYGKWSIIPYLGLRILDFVRSLVLMYTRLC